MPRERNRGIHQVSQDYSPGCRVLPDQPADARNLANYDNLLCELFRGPSRRQSASSSPVKRSFGWTPGRHQPRTTHAPGLTPATPLRPMAYRGPRGGRGPASDIPTRRAMHVPVPAGSGRIRIFYPVLGLVRMARTSYRFGGFLMGRPSRGVLVRVASRGPLSPITL